MRKLPVKRQGRAVRDTAPDPMEVLEREAPRRDPFVSFSYSFTEISSHGGKAKLRARSERFKNGKLSSEKFEGELDHAVWERAAGEVQRRLLGQMALFMKPFSMLLPFGARRPPERDR